MTGAGSSTLLFGFEGAFLGSSPTQWYHFGRNPTVNELDLQNQLERLREAGLIQAAESRKTNFEGAISVSATVNAATFDRVREAVFNDNGTGFQTGRPNSMEILAGSKYLTETGVSSQYRALKGGVPTDFSVSYEQGGMVTFDLSIIYGDENPDQSVPDAANITSPGGGDDTAFHDFNLVVDSVSVPKLQSAELSFSNLYRFHFGADPTPVDASLAAPQATLSLNATYAADKRLNTAYGQDVSPTDQIDAVDGNITLDAGAQDVATFTLPRIKPDTYSWNDLINADADLNEQIEHHVNGQVSIA